MPAIQKARSNRAHLSPRYKGPVDAGGYTPEPRELANPAKFNISRWKRDLRKMKKVVTEIQADSVRNGTNKMTMDEINAEIAAVRAARRAASLSRH
jgi:hypothetical protein